MNFLQMNILGMEILDSVSFSNLALRFLLNIVVTGVIIFAVYYRRTQRKEFMVTFTLISLTVFFLVFLLDNVTLQLGFALGLFAIFGIIRYRTIVIPIKEMTYLFILIGISVLNALADIKTNYLELFAANFMLMFCCWFFESRFIKKRISTKVVMYDNIKLIHAGMEAELKKDLEERLGLQIVKVEIESIDLLKDCAMLNVSYSVPSNKLFKRPVSGLYW